MAKNKKLPNAPKTVVVAEDESIIRMDITDTLTEAGYQVVGEASDGEAAVAMTFDLHPDLVIMDIKMPMMDGISAAEKIGNHSAVILLTAFSQKKLVERAAEVGVMGYVVKPFGPDDLLPTLEIAMARFDQLGQLESEIADLNERFETRKLVDHAKGLLSEQMGLSEPEAFRWIQKSSMDRRLTMREVSRAVIEQLGRKRNQTPS